jgi:hypothetical protein
MLDKLGQFYRCCFPSRRPLLMMAVRIVSAPAQSGMLAAHAGACRSTVVSASAFGREEVVL